MKCPECKTDNPDHRKFCRECGEKLLLLCPQCNTENIPGDKFCGECGHNLTKPSEALTKELSFDEKLDKIQRYLPQGLTEKILAQRNRIEGERKQVTVMFCDMEGFTQLSDKLGPEDAYNIMDQVYEILIHKVHDYEGTVNEMTGDGIMALFGAPVALEDAPQRAIRSSLSIHREIAKFNDRMKQEKENILQLRMRIGIHSGPVIVGTLGNDLRVEFKAVGDTVNLASRTEGLAEPGTTYITEDTFKLAEGFFRFEALGERKIKGKEKPVQIYRAIAPSTRRTQFDISAERGLTPFVGRDRELELLLEGFERAKTGRGQAYSIMAEAGLGKSRLLYEFRKAVTHENVTFLEGKCLSYGKNVAYHPVIDTLRANFNIKEGDADLEIKEKVIDGLKILGIDEVSSLHLILELLSVKDSGIDKISMSPETKKGRTIEAVKRITLKGSEIKPLIIATENLHWIDKSSEEYLQYLMHSISGARMFLIFTYRPEYVYTWGAKSYHSQVNLNRLSNRESLAMASHLLGNESLEKELEELILEKTEGVPFFIEEFIKSLKDLQIIEKKGYTYRISKDVRAVSIPAKIQDVIMARVDSLPEDAKEMVQTVSVAGREFNHELIKRVVDLPEKHLLSHLSVLKDSELLYERGIYPQSTYIFKHALTQEVVYNGLLLKRREEIHKKIGSSIEQIYADKLEEFYEILAYHYSKCDSLEKACQYLRLSGEKASRSYSNWEAFQFYKQAINLLKKLSETDGNRKEQLHIYRLISDCLYPLGYPEDSLQILQEGEKLSEESGDEPGLANFHRNIGMYFGTKGKLVQAVEYQKKSLQDAKKIKDFKLTMQVTTELCISYARAGNHYKVTNVASGVIDHLEGMKGKPELFQTVVVNYSRLCSIYGLSLGLLGDLKKGIIYCEKGIAAGDKIGDIFNLAVCEFHHGNLYVYMGDPQLAIKHYEKSIKYHEESKSIGFSAMAWSLLGYAHYLLGDALSAQTHAEKSLKLQRESGIEFFNSLLHWVLSQIELDFGNNRSARNHAEAALKLSRECSERHFEGLALVSLGRIYSNADPPQYDKATDQILKGIEIFEELKYKPFFAQGYFYLGELHTNSGRKEKALENLKKAEGMFQEMEMDYWLARTQKVLARI
jgi:class 3 adenylate cyclase/tetratricopeptide (TPR) repeat protein